MVSEAAGTLYLQPALVLKGLMLGSSDQILPWYVLSRSEPIETVVLLLGYLVLPELSPWGAQAQGRFVTKQHW